MDDLHRYALDEQGNTIHIKDVTSGTRHDRFYCSNCGGEMIPVLGTIREWHFRHKVVTPSCSYESYLHKIGKEILKKRFYSQDTFIASFFIEYSCDKTERCVFKEKLSYLRCNKREKRTIDLKQLYDTCEEEKSFKGYRADLMLSHSEHPEREPLFIEISYTHDCTQEKLASGIQIIEIKVKDDKDFEMPFEEQGVMFMDFSSANPYAFTEAPPIRFYNFPRQEKFAITLNRFIVFKDDKLETHGLVLPQTTTCQSFYKEHLRAVQYEVVSPKEIMNQGNKNNLYVIGLALAMKRGYKVKHCGFCAHHYVGHRGCVIKTTKEIVDKRTVKTIRKWTAELPNDFDRSSLAIKCNKFFWDRIKTNRILESFNDIPYYERRNREL